MLLVFLPEWWSESCFSVFCFAAVWALGGCCRLCRFPARPGWLVRLPFFVRHEPISEARSRYLFLRKSENTTCFAA